MNLRERAAIGLLILMLAACGSSGGTGVPSSSPTPARTTDSSAEPVARPALVAVTERDFRFDTPDITVEAGATLDVTNAGPTVHNLAIRDAGGTILETTKDLKAGSAEPLVITAAPGRYAILCTLPGHESLGLKGTLTVTP